ncbi:WD40 repeat domain-containing protein [Microcoleus sp. FACHB-672]|uniref:WD40 repeat domain-containing protein n=1 Tax=Microcoleus sp. FACHB-672 TaxID=2692825 RepID=UPI0016834F67|nr:WD40 repeat domain-containing protein [Microcoleus sp. FACHB-672]MBD2039111.1 WD40 repeat domain-containing protein [Microcoleus sp. FACHB-672]
MDWTTPLKFQQADFIKRLKSDAANLLHSQTRGCHSELMVLSGEKLTKIRDFCRQTAVNIEQHSPVSDIIHSFLKRQLGQAVVATYLEGLALEIDPLKYQKTKDSVDFTLLFDSNLGIQVKTEYGNIDSVRWPIYVEEIKQNVAIVCILLQEEVSEDRQIYHAIVAGFAPTNTIAIRQGQANLGIADLLYAGGLRSYLESFKTEPSFSDGLHILTGSSNYVYPFAISADGEILASSNYDGSIKLWQLNNKELQAALSGQSWSFYPLATGGGGQILASGSTDKKLYQCHAGTGSLRHSLAGHSSGVSAITISADRQILISGGYDGSLKIWNLETGKLQRRIAAHAGTVRPIAISYDRKILATGSIDKTLKVWSLDTGEVLRILPVRTDPVVSIAISPDDQTLVSGSQDGTIDIWHLDTGELKSTLPGHSGTVRAIAISPDGQTLATGSTEKTIKLWDVQTGELKSTLTGHSDPIINVAPNPNGKSLELSLLRHQNPGWVELC